MAIGEHVEEFVGLPVYDYSPVEGIVDPMERAPRLSVEYEAEVTIPELLDQFLADPASRQVRALIIGNWGEPASDGSAPIVEALAAARDRLPALEALFLGDITSDECEISWITQSDV